MEPGTGPATARAPGAAPARAMPSPPAPRSSCRRVDARNVMDAIASVACRMAPSESPMPAGDFGGRIGVSRLVLDVANAFVSIVPPRGSAEYNHFLFYGCFAHRCERRATAPLGSAGRIAGRAGSRLRRGVFPSPISQTRRMRTRIRSETGSLPRTRPVRQTCLRGRGEPDQAEGCGDMVATLDDRQRCSWVGVDPLMVAYHDEEWGVPCYDDRQLFARLMLEGFQAGLSWSTVLRKRRRLRPRVRGVGRRADRGVRSGRHRPAARRSRHHPEPSEDRGRDPQRRGLPPGQRRTRLLRRLHLVVRRRVAVGQERAGDGVRRPGDDARIRRDGEGPEASRIHLRRLDDLLRLHAERGPGRRPRRGVLAGRLAGGSVADASRSGTNRGEGTFSGVDRMRRLARSRSA